MLVDPFTIAANAPTPALVMSVIRSDGYGSERRDATGTYKLVIAHTPNDQTNRHLMKLSMTKDVADPYTGLTKKREAVVTLSASFPGIGWTLTEQSALVQALIDILLDAEVTKDKWVGFQS